MDELDEHSALTLDYPRLLEAERYSRAQAEELAQALRHSTSRLREFIIQAPAGIAITHGPDFVFEFTNPCYEKIAGRTGLVGQSLRQALPELQEQPGVMEVLQHVMRSGEPFHAREFCIRLDRCGDGRLEDCYFNLTYQPLRNAHGHVDGLLTYAVEVTEHVRARREVESLAQQLQDSEERLRLTLEAAWVGTWEWNIPDNRVSWSKNIEAIFGLPPGSFAGTYEAWLALVHPEDRETLARKVEETLETGSSYAAEFRFMRPDGSIGWQGTRGHLVLDAEGQPQALRGVVFDITDRKRVEEEALRRAEFEQQLIGIVSHDLRNPISAMMMSASALLKHEDVEPRLMKGLARIVSSGERAARLIRDLLDFTQARLGSGIPIQRQLADLHLIAAQAVEEVQQTYPDREVKLVAMGDGSGEWDADRLTQIVTNLVANALAYSPPETPVRVRTHGQRGCVALEVHNGGEPIAPELLPTLFEPFRRGREFRHTRTGNVGLGLFIVDQLVRAHGGRICVSSTAEQGTTFTVMLPRR